MPSITSDFISMKHALGGSLRRGRCSFEIVSQGQLGSARAIDIGGDDWQRLPLWLRSKGSNYPRDSELPIEIRDGPENGPTPVASPCGRLHSRRSHNPAQNNKGSSVDSGEPFFFVPRVARFYRSRILRMQNRVTRPRADLANKRYKVLKRLGMSPFLDKQFILHWPSRWTFLSSSQEQSYFEVGSEVKYFAITCL